MKLFITLSYVGTNYCGFQSQKNGKSIQEVLTKAVEEIFPFPCDITGCSRTDAGVHAHMFCATICQKGTNELKTEIAIEKMPIALSMHLPEDIRVYDAKWVENEFHARYDCKEKEYIYRLWNHQIMNPFENGFAVQTPRFFDEKAIEKMQEACKYFLGKHDFCAFMAVGSKIEDTTRTITKCYFEVDGNFLTLHIAGDGFLYNMVRIIVGTLMRVGEGKFAPSDMEKIINSKDRFNAGPTYSACGLYLEKVVY